MKDTEVSVGVDEGPAIQQQFIDTHVQVGVRDHNQRDFWGYPTDGGAGHGGYMPSVPLVGVGP